MKPIRFHPAVQRDIDDLIEYYEAISESLSDGVWNEIELALKRIQNNPERFHFDTHSSGFRRCNLKRFPYHILYLVGPDRIRIQVIRHNKRSPGYGMKRKRY